jgi:hypothetical protein
MKAYRLWVRKSSVASSAAEELVVNPSDFSCGQVLEIDHTNDVTSRLILQVTSTKIDAKAGQIGVSQNVASLFQLKHHRDVNVKPVGPKDVMLELVELELKDQYVCRSDMWHLKETLQEKCVYVTKKIEFAGIRARVSGLWMAQQSVMSGYISSDTKIVFRSCSCVYYVFIQMSCEMWTFDPYGDLYFERAVGFLRELFDQWKVKECNHEVSLILFSRTFYGGALCDDFRSSDRETIQMDPSGRCYQDFYKVVSHSQTVSDFGPLLLDLKRCFSPYLTWVNCGRESGSVSHPNGRLSVASDGNILEAINLALGAFERHHIDQQFDKVGHQILIITPSVGLFEVDRRLTYLTKQRSLDSGYGIDLVCLSAQPLHVAPLFMFRRLHRGSVSGGNDYNIPYWINCSFHTSEAQATRNRQGKFTPKISMRDFKEKSEEKDKRPCAIDLSLNVVEVRDGSSSIFSEEDKLQRVDYDAYDALVFNLHVRGQRRVSRLRSSNTELANRNLDTLDLEGLSDDRYMSLLATSSPTQTVKQQIPRQGSLGVIFADNSTGQQTLSKDIVDNLNKLGHSRQTRGNVTGRKSFGFEGEQALLSLKRPYHGRHGSRPLVNPFAPSRVPVIFSFHRSRWSHTYRHDLDGQCIREHRVVKEEPPQMTTEIVEEKKDSLSSWRMSEAAMFAARDAVSAQVRERLGLHPLQTDEGDEYGFLESFATERDMAQTPDADDSVLSFLTPPTSPSKRYQQSFPRLGQVGEPSSIPVAKWRLELIGMDWKSLLTPACLPLTTALAPSNLDNNYYENPYSLFADDSGLTSGIQSLNSNQIYRELISQRLCKGYQLVNEQSNDEIQAQIVSRPLFPAPAQQQIYLSMGKSHHCIKLNSPQVEVTIFKPKHQQYSQPVRYHYKVCDFPGNGFQPSSATFHKDMNDDFNWNYLDHYVCGDSDFKELVDSLKYWRSRYLLLPVVMDMKADSRDANEVIQRRIKGMMQFLEALHKMRRPSSASASKANTRRLSVPDTLAVRHQHLLKQALTLAGNSPPVVKRQNRHSSLQPPGLYEDEGDKDFINREGKDVKPAEDVEFRSLTETSPLEEISSAMKDPKFGVEILNSASGRINDCFLGCDVVTWLVDNVAGLDSRNKAVVLAQKLVRNRYIVHCSGDSSHRVVDGFYLYRTVKGEEKSDRIDTSFSDMWMEVNVERQQLNCWELGQASFRHPLMSTPTPTSPPTPSVSAKYGSISKGSSLNMKEIDHRPRKVVTVNVDPQGKSNRPEWCTVRYDSMYSPAHGFCLEFHWLVATPSLVHDVVTQLCYLQL